jgi:hypothetical protein
LKQRAAAQKRHESVAESELAQGEEAERQRRLKMREDANRQRRNDWWEHQRKRNTKLADVGEEPDHDNGRSDLYRKTDKCLVKNAHGESRTTCAGRWRVAKMSRFAKLSGFPPISTFFAVFPSFPRSLAIRLFHSFLLLLSPSSFPTSSDVITPCILDRHPAGTILPHPRMPSFSRIILHRYIDYAKYMGLIEPFFQFLEEPDHLPIGSH